MIPLLLIAAGGFWIFNRAQQSTAAAQAAMSAPAAVGTAAKSNLIVAGTLTPAPAPTPTQGAEPAYWVDQGDNSEFVIRDPRRELPVTFSPSSTLYTSLGGGIGGGGGGANGGGGAGGGGGHAFR